MERIELLVGRMLRLGVLVSGALIALGTLLMIVQHGLYGSVGAATLGAVWAGLRRLRGWAVVDVGLLLLILTPVLRVAISILGFGRSRDWVFVTVTSFVLVMLIVGFLIGKA